MAVAGVIFQNSFHDKLAAIPSLAHLADDYSRDATAVVRIISQMPDNPERTTLMIAYNDGLRTIWLTLIGFSAFGLLLSTLVRSYSLQQEHVTKQALVETHKKKPDVESGNASEK